MVILVWAIFGCEFREPTLAVVCILVENFSSYFLNKLLNIGGINTPIQPTASYLTYVIIFLIKLAASYLFRVRRFGHALKTSK